MILPPVKKNVASQTGLGSLAILFYLIHAAYWLRQGIPANILWACHIATLLVGVGLLVRQPRLTAVGLSWLILGTPLWLLDLLSHPLYPTSLFTHVGGLVIGVWGVWRYGFPRHTWLWALVGLAILQQICRWITPPAENVNLAFAVFEGWEEMFPHYGRYLLLLASLAAAAFYALEQVAQKYVAISPKGTDQT